MKKRKVLISTKRYERLGKLYDEYNKLYQKRKEKEILRKKFSRGIFIKITARLEDEIVGKGESKIVKADVPELFDEFAAYLTESQYKKLAEFKGVSISDLKKMDLSEINHIIFEYGQSMESAEEWGEFGFES